MARSASQDEIHDAYRRLARLVHPDLNADRSEPLAGSPDIRLVNEAWDVLGRPALRDAYDRATQLTQNEDEGFEFGVDLPPVPEGFYLHPRKGWLASGHWYTHRFADERQGALSLVAESADLSTLSRLEDDELWLLDLMRLPVTDSDVRALKRFHKLEVLLLDDSGVTDAGLDWLRRLPALTTLSLSGCHITDDGMPALAEIPSLQNLELDQTRVTDDGLAALAGHPSLVVLDIRRTKVRGRGLRHLVGLPNLRELRVSGWAELAANRAFRDRPEVRIL